MELNSNTYFGNTEKVEQYLKELSENHQRINYGKLNKNIANAVPEYLTLLQVCPKLEIPENKETLLAFTDAIQHNYYDCENYIGYPEYESDDIVHAYNTHEQINQTIQKMVEDKTLSFPLKPTDVTREDMKEETRLYKLTAYTNFVKEIASKIVFLPLSDVMKNVTGQVHNVSENLQNEQSNEKSRSR